MSQKITLTTQQRKYLSVATIISLLFMAWFLRTFFILIVFAGIMAYLFSPIYLWMTRRKLSTGGSAAVTLLGSVLFVVIPIALVLVFASSQLRSVFDDVSSFMTTLNVDSATKEITETANSVLSKLPGEISISSKALEDSIKTGIEKVGLFLVNSLTSVVSSFSSFVTGLIIYIYLFLAFLIKGKKIITMYKDINPLGPDISEMYLKKASAMVRGTVQGQFIIALTQGLFAATTFALVGYGELFFVLFILFTVLSVIPLGAGIIIIPLGVALIISGNIAAGLIVIAEHILINTNVDNVLRPILVPKEARLDSALMLISVFAGIRVFGFAGIVIGPTLMILAVSTIEVHLSMRREKTTLAP